MNTDSELFEEVVRRVLQALEPQPRSGSAPVTANGSTGTLVSETVITREVLEQAVIASGTIRVAPRAILTPSARDFIRARGVAVVREAARSTGSKQKKWQVLSAVGGAEAAAALAEARSSGAAAAPLAGSVEEAVTQAVSSLCRAETEGIVALTGEPEKFACLANRNDRIRATVVCDEGSVSRLVASFQPNLLVVNPTGKSSFEMKRLLKAILAT